MALSFRLEQCLGVVLNVLAVFLQLRCSAGKNNTKGKGLSRIFYFAKVEKVLCQNKVDRPAYPWLIFIYSLAF